MFRFSKEQSIVNVAGVKFGGQSGELPSVLCGTIFYHGHKIVEDEQRGLFDRTAAERLISRQAELSEETGCPSVLHLYARSAPAFERYLDFADQVWCGPFIIDSADAATRCAAALLVSELGYADRAIYNSISLATEEKEVQVLRGSEIDSAIILAYNPSEPGVDGSLSILETGGSVLAKGLLPLAREMGMVNLLIDPAVLP
ncbi:MAG: tetrahydromethanopterin S-methyltransferase subunit H, partial [Methanothrix sp.]